MYRITFKHVDRPGLELETRDFATVAQYVEQCPRCSVRSWEHFNAKGQRTGGGAGVNAYPNLIAYAEMCGEEISF